MTLSFSFTLMLRTNFIPAMAASGPIMPVHTRNDIENIALCGEENFNKFCWWPDYPETRHALGQYWAFYRLAEYYFVSC